jgi:hypothetical protein
MFSVITSSILPSGILTVGLYTAFWSENLKWRDHLEDLGVDGKIILEWILGK